MTFCNCTMGNTAACEGCPNNPVNKYWGTHYVPSLYPTYKIYAPSDAREEAMTNRHIPTEKTIVEEYDENGKLTKRTITQ